MFVAVLAVLPVAVGGLWVVSKLEQGAHAPPESKSVKVAQPATEEFSLLAVVRASGCSVSPASAERFASVSWPTDGVFLVHGTSYEGGVSVKARSANGEESFAGTGCKDRSAMWKRLTSSALWEQHVKSKKTCESGSPCERLVEFSQLLAASGDGSPDESKRGEPRARKLEQWQQQRSEDRVEAQRSAARLRLEHVCARYPLREDEAECLRNMKAQYPHLWD
jgi:hypothetical protein